MRIKEREIGGGAPAFIVAELSGNHQQKFETAAETVRAIHASGADAVKLQTYTPDTITIDCDAAPFQIRKGTLWDGRTLYDLYREAYTPWEWQPELKRIAEDLGLICFSSPFDLSSVDFLEKMNVPAYKVAAFEITDIPLIEYIASKGKPVIFSTGVAEEADIREALAACRKAGNDQIAVLKCTSAYPAPYEEINLRTIPDIADRFGVVAGLSDHTLGISIPLAAAALGAGIIEKHFILDRALGGPDAAFSLEPAEFSAMVRGVREVEKARGAVTYELSGKARRNREFSRSLFVVRDVKAGERFTPDNVRSIRPADGMHPRHLRDVLGKKAARDARRGTPLSPDLVTE